MSPIDAAAAEAVEFIEKYNRKPQTERLRSGWSKFIMSLLYRTPDQVKWLNDKIRAADDDFITSIPIQYEKMRRETDPPRYEDYRTEGGSDLIEEAQAILLRKLIDSERIGSHLNNMKWIVGEFHNQRHGLLTSDSPVIMSNGLGSKNSFLILPIGPSKFFLASNTDEVIRSFTDQQPSKFERALNIAVVKQAESLVIGNTRGHLRFVQNHMGQNGSIIKQGGLNRAFWRAPI